MTATFCSSCARCGTEPYDGHPAKRYCGATPEVRAQHAARSESALMSFWTAPREFTYTNSQAAERCEFYLSKVAPK